MRQSIRHQAGTEEAQSPPSIRPILRLIGCASPSKCGRPALSAFQRSSSAQRPDHPVGGVDGVRPRAHLAHMDRPAPDLDPEPQDAGIGAHQHLLLRLGDQHRVGAVAAQMGHQGAVAGRFLFHHRLQRHGGGGLEPDAAERVEGEQVGGMPRLHVGAAAAIEPVALHHRREGRVGPEVGGARRHHVDMGLEDQRAPPLLPRPVDADDDRRLGMLRREPGAARMRLDLRPVHRESGPWHSRARETCGRRSPGSPAPRRGSRESASAPGCGRPARKSSRRLRRRCGRAGRDPGASGAPRRQGRPLHSRDAALARCTRLQAGVPGDAGRGGPSPAKKLTRLNFHLYRNIPRPGASLARPSWTAPPVTGGRGLEPRRS